MFEKLEKLLRTERRPLSTVPKPINNLDEWLKPSYTFGGQMVQTPVKADGSANDDGDYEYTLKRPPFGKLDSIPAAYACINTLANAMAQCPIVVADLKDPVENYWEAMPDHPISVLMRKPSQIMDPWQFWEHQYRALHAQGMAIAWIRRSARSNLPIELVPATLHKVPEWVGRSRRRYELNLMGRTRGAGSPGKPRIVGDEDVLMMAGPGYDGLTAPSPIQLAAKRPLQMLDASIRHQLQTLTEANVRNAISVSGELADLDPALLNQLEDRMRNNYEEARKKGKWVILSPGYDLASATGLSAVDMQIVELLQWLVPDIARVWNMPPRQIGHYHEGFRATKFEYQAEDFERYAVRGHALRIAMQIQEKMLTEQDVRARRVMRMPTEMLTLGSWSERVTATKEATDGVLSRDEGRKRLGYGPWPESPDLIYEPKGAPSQDGGEDPENPEGGENDEGEDGEPGTNGN